MPQVSQNRYNFTLRRFLDLGNTFLEQTLRLKTLGYLLFIQAFFFFYLLIWLPHDQILVVISQTVSLTQC